MWQTLSKDEQTVTLSRFDGFNEDVKTYKGNDRNYKVACIVDVETTGLDKNSDSIIEIGMRVFYFDPSNGEILHIGNSYSSLHDPKRQIDARITKITGLKYSDLKNKCIDWKNIAELLEDVNLVIAHNAAFDRSFFDRHISEKNIQYSKRAVWACTIQQVDWINYGFPTSNLQLLGAFHGMFTSSHRAQSDVDMLVKILQYNPKYLFELYQNAHISRARIKILNTSYEHRTELKKRHYIWNPSTKSWRKIIKKLDAEDEIRSIKLAIPNFEPQIEIEEIPLSENFKTHF